MRVVVDTNVLLRLFQANHPHTSIAEAAVNTLIKNGHSLCVVPQNLYDFWAVATRPVSNNGLGIQAYLPARSLKYSFEVSEDRVSNVLYSSSYNGKDPTRPLVDDVVPKGELHAIAVSWNEPLS